MPCNVAGSAIAQGKFVGRIDQLKKWNPTGVEALWLLLSGASNPPGEINVSDRRTRDIPEERSGSFLSGVISDLRNMEEAVATKLDNTLKNFYLTKSDAIREIQRFFNKCRDRELKPMLYYTGHGESGTGNWCFHDGTISIEEIVDLLPGGTYFPIIFSDACYSGHWANFCLNHCDNANGLNCLAACPEFSTAMDTKGEGGDLTLYMTGKKLRPDTEPIYSGGNRLKFPITDGYDSVFYLDLLMSYLNNTHNILICQSIHDGYFYGCFAPSNEYKPRPTIEGLVSFSEEDFMLPTANGYIISSLACDENLGFGVVLMHRHGLSQIIVNDVSGIREGYDAGYFITECAARDSKYYIVMTKDVNECDNEMQQKAVSERNWSEIREEVERGYEEGMVITGICYSPKLREYLLVMTESPAGQNYKWFDEGFPITPWLNNLHKEGFHPTIIFKDPADGKVLVVVTTDDNRSTFTAALHYKIKTEW
ncbi:uncharacterized protein LOC111345226 isoform X1 [Stylophora pistillata]|uniref:Uncharacterized protein n=1 Tax=Stylophora pistillata TaxID=50429 RepID=A0A2B4RBA4_STYPI|nr:uncharacterized protein LOC111345226 isoform X1 [Stylophora pistillata]XP_022808239.1 uncharacterized protein LOC111345226 isoform X1 [Stylophora pistillata]PFX14089.1 hypothetical protein AWC38_SpisGene21786 [Stylophora pistillata]